MEYHQRKTIRGLSQELKRELDLDDVLKPLKEKGVLTEQNMGKIRNSAPEEGMKSFLDLLLGGGHQAFSVFIDTLEECGETYKGLVQKLKDTEKSLKTVLEHEVREFTSILKGKESFMFMDMVLNVAEGLDKSDVIWLAKHFELSSNELKEIKKSGDPGIRFLQMCYKTGRVTPEDISELLDACYHLKFLRPHKTALEYMEALRSTEFTLKFNAGGNSDVLEVLPQAACEEVLGDHQKFRKIDYYCKGNYEARLFDIEFCSNTMILKIPNLQSIDDVIDGIESGELVKVVLQSLFYSENQSDASSSQDIPLQIAYDEEAYNCIRKEFPPAENDSVSSSNSEESEGTFQSAACEFFEIPEEISNEDEPISGITRYGYMLAEVMESITGECCRKMGIILNLTAREKETASNAASLIQIMEDKDLLSDQNVSTLLELLKKLDIQKAVKVVERYKQIQPSFETSPLQTPEQKSEVRKDTGFQTQDIAKPQGEFDYPVFPDEAKRSVRNTSQSSLVTFDPSFQISPTQRDVYAHPQSLETHYKSILDCMVPVLSNNVTVLQIIKYMKLNDSSFTQQDLLLVEQALRRKQHKTFVEILKSKGYNDYELFLDHLFSLSMKSAKAVMKKEMKLVPGANLKKVRIGRLKNRTTMSIQEDSIDYCSKSKGYISVVLVGKTGSGKSSTANTLVGKDDRYDISQYYNQSYTNRIEVEETHFGNTCLKVMDTPGLFDTRGKIFPGMDNDDKSLELAKAVIEFPDGIDVFLIVGRLDEPFTEEAQKAIEKIEECYGGNLHFYDHCILILTRGKEMQPHTLREHLSHLDEKCNLSHLIQKVQSRVIVVENKWTKSKLFKEVQREWLITQICSFIKYKDSVNRGKYTNEHFTIAKQLLDSKAENDLRNSSVRKYTASFVRAYIIGADEGTLQRLMNDNTLNENEILKLKAFIEEKNLLTEHINVDISELASQIVSNSGTIIQKQLCGKSREKEIMQQLEMEKKQQTDISEIKHQMQISILQFMDKNKDNLSSLQSLLDHSTFPRDLHDYVNESQNFRLMTCERSLDLTRKVLSDTGFQDIIKLGIQKIQKETAVDGKIALEPNSARLTIKVLNVLKGFNISDLNDLKRNAESGKLEQSIKWRQLSTLKFTQKDISRNLILAIVNKHVDSVIEIKKLENIQMEEMTKQKNLLELKKKVNSQLFEEIEIGDEKMLKELTTDGSKQIFFQKLCTKLKDFPGIPEEEEDIKRFLELPDESIINIMKRRYNDVKTLRKELDEALKAHEQVEKERDEAEQRLNDIVNEISEKFIRGLNKREVLNLKEQSEADELTIPAKLFKKVKHKILLEHKRSKQGAERFPAPWSDEEIRRIINSVVRSKKKILEEIMNTESCFPSTSLVTTLQAGKIPIGEVALGDKVLTVKENFVFEYEEIFFIAHANKSGFCCYLVLETSSKTSIAISPNHCLPVGNIKCMKPANQVKVNDLIFVNRDGILISDTVTSIKSEFRRGAYCPYTLSGTLIVDNIVASCFTTTVAPHIAQTVLFPLRCLYRCTPLPLYKTVFSNSKMKLISERANVGSHVLENILLYIKNAF